MKTVTYRLELPNGGFPQFALYAKRIMAGQDLEAWKANPEALNKFFRGCFASYLENVSVVICTREGSAK